jgi:hypothetical protein
MDYDFFVRCEDVFCQNRNFQNDEVNRIDKNNFENFIIPKTLIQDKKITVQTTINHQKYISHFTSHKNTSSHFHISTS